jgi:hypothetical protein
VEVITTGLRAPHRVRVLVIGRSIFLGFGAIALFGMGLSNVVGAPQVKSIPDRYGTR